MRTQMVKKSSLPRPSIVDAIMDDVPDLCRDSKSLVVVSAGGRDRGPMVARGPGGGKRLVHGDIERVEVQYEQDRQPQTVTRLVDTLAALYRKGTVTEAMLIAGKRFQDDFDNAHMESMPSMRMDGMPSSGKSSSDPHRTPSIIDARTNVFAAMNALGGFKGPCGIVAEWVLGKRWSLRQLAERETVKRVAVWTGTLTGALGVLEAHYQSVDNSRRRQ